jgi:hypothetical protein
LNQKKPTLPKWQTSTRAFTRAAKSMEALVWRSHWSCSLGSRAEGSKRLGAGWTIPGGNGQKLWVEPTEISPSSTA